MTVIKRIEIEDCEDLRAFAVNNQKNINHVIINIDKHGGWPEVYEYIELKKEEFESIDELKAVITDAYELFNGALENEERGFHATIYKEFKSILHEN